MEKELKLLGTWSSPFCTRVVLALRLKGLEYEFSEEDLSNKSSLLLEYNPVYKKIPVLLHNEKPIVESSVIVEYIDEMWKHNPLLPSDPYGKAMARFWIKFIDDKLKSSVWGAFVKQGKEQEEDLIAANVNLKILDQELMGKEFFGGEDIGIVDIFLASIVNLIKISDDHITGWKMIDSKKHPLLYAWMDKLFGFTVIADALPPRDKLIVKFSRIREDYAANKLAPTKS